MSQRARQRGGSDGQAGSWRHPSPPVAEWSAAGQEPTNGHPSPAGTFASALDPSSTPSQQPLVALVPDPLTRAIVILLCQGEDPTELAHKLLHRPRRDPRAHLAALNLLDQVARLLAPHQLPRRSPISRIVKAYVSDRQDRWILLLRISCMVTMPEIASSLGIHRVTAYRSLSRAMKMCANAASRLSNQRGSSDTNRTPMRSSTEA